MGLSKSFGFTTSVAPSCFAISNFDSLVSMAIIRPAFAITEPINTDKPMPPKPNTATVSPACTLAALVTAPIPVVTPQPSRHTFSSGASFGILANEISATTVCSAKVDVPM